MSAKTTLDDIHEVECDAVSFMNRMVDNYGLSVSSTFENECTHRSLGGGFFRRVDKNLKRQASTKTPVNVIKFNEFYPTLLTYILAEPDKSSNVTDLQYFLLRVTTEGGSVQEMMFARYLFGMYARPGCVIKYNFDMPYEICERGRQIMERCFEVIGEDNVLIANADEIYYMTDSRNSHDSDLVRLLGPHFGRHIKYDWFEISTLGPNCGIDAHGRFMYPV